MDSTGEPSKARVARRPLTRMYHPMATFLLRQALRLGVHFPAIVSSIARRKEMPWREGMLLSVNQGGSERNRRKYGRLKRTQTARPRTHTHKSGDQPTGKVVLASNIAVSLRPVGCSEHRIRWAKYQRTEPRPKSPKPPSQTHMGEEGHCAGP